MAKTLLLWLNYKLQSVIKHNIKKYDHKALLLFPAVVPRTQNLQPWGQTLHGSTLPPSILPRIVLCDNCVRNICVLRWRIFHLPLNCETQDFASNSNLAGETSFSKIDLVRAYHLFSFTEDDVIMTNIVAPYGLCEFSRTPFGLRNSPQIFQRLIDDVCCDLDFVFL